MGKRRRFTQLASTDDDDDDDDDETPAAASSKSKKKKKTTKPLRRCADEDEEFEVENEEEVDEEDDVDEDEEYASADEPPSEEEAEEGEEMESRRRKRKGRAESVAAAVAAAEEDSEEGEGEGGGGGGGEDDGPEAVPLGDVVKVSGKGKNRKKHYASFEYEGNTFELEDSVLLTPEDLRDKPYVAIIKDITENNKGGLYVTGQWFYRPEEAEKRGGGSWEARDTRELFYSFHVDDVPAESVMHKCVVHFVPQNKQLPNRKQHPGFIVQKVYDTVERKLWKLTDKDYEDTKQHEIDLLVQKTRERIGELPNIEPEDVPADNVDQLAIKRNLRRRPVNPIDVSKPDDPSGKYDHFMKAETPGSCSDALKNHALLLKFKALTGDSYRDKWLDKLVEAVTVACNTKESALADHKGPISAALTGPATTGNNRAAHGAATKDNGSHEAGKGFTPDVVVPVMTALERATHEALGFDFQKYNQKLRQLLFNLKNSPILARRLLNKELDPPVLLTMSPNELKDGLTAEEKSTSEPEESKQLQMTDARCSRCMEKKVGISEIIHAGGHGDRYQLECTSCGHTWYASRDAISALTVDAPNASGNVGTAPWATAKFDVLEKQLVSPREQTEKPSAAVFQKSTAAYIPTLETQKSFNRSKTDESAVNAANHE